MTEFHSKDLNVLSFRGAELSPTGLQMNVASVWKGGTLVLSIGTVQVQWHVDIKDATGHWTLIVILHILPGISYQVLEWLY